MIVAILYTHCCKDNYYTLFNTNPEDFHTLKHIKDNDPEYCGYDGLYCIERNYGDVDQLVDDIIKRLTPIEIIHQNLQEDEFVKLMTKENVVCLREMVC